MLLDMPATSSTVPMSRHLLPAAMSWSRSSHSDPREIDALVQRLPQASGAPPPVTHDRPVARRPRSTPARCRPPVADLTLTVVARITPDQGLDGASAGTETPPPTAVVVCSPTRSLPVRHAGPWLLLAIGEQPQPHSNPMTKTSLTPPTTSAHAASQSVGRSHPRATAASPAGASPR